MGLNCDIISLIPEFQKLDKQNINDSIFAIIPNLLVMKQTVRWQLAKRRSGNHKTKVISEIRGTTAKPYRQKGTGRARQGSLRSVQFRGGSTIFGPVVRSHSFKLPKKVRKLALKSALSMKQSGNKLSVLQKHNMEKPSTSQISKILDKANIKSVLFVVTDDFCQNFKCSISNIKNVDYIHVIGLNVYDILRHDNLIISQDALEKIEERLV